MDSRKSSLRGLMEYRPSHSVLSLRAAPLRTLLEQNITALAGTTLILVLNISMASSVRWLSMGLSLGSVILFENF